MGRGIPSPESAGIKHPVSGTEGAGAPGPYRAEVL